MHQGMMLMQGTGPGFWSISAADVITLIVVVTGVIIYLVRGDERSKITQTETDKAQADIEKLEDSMGRLALLEERFEFLTEAEKRMRADVDRLAQSVNDVPRSLLMGRLDDLRMELRAHVNDDREIQERIATDLKVHRDGEGAFYTRMEALLQKIIQNNA